MLLERMPAGPTNRGCETIGEALCLDLRLVFKGDSTEDRVATLQADVGYEPGELADGVVYQSAAVDVHRRAVGRTGMDVRGRRTHCSHG